MIVVKAPGNFDKYWNYKMPRIFLAGSIEMGKAVDWQAQFTESMREVNALILNPRRDDWDSSWVQSIDNPQFHQQVRWELQGMEAADIIPMFFAPSTQSPITLMELGLQATSKKLIVCCPEGFWRKGNVDIVCKKYHIEQAASVEELIQKTYKRIELMGYYTGKFPVSDYYESISGCTITDTSPP
jgi:hypothetical protein